MGECALFSFNKYPIYTHDGASAKFSNNSQETDNSAARKHMALYWRTKHPVPENPQKLF